MLKTYQYKMQWLFSKKEINKAFNLFGARALTVIHIRDMNLKIIASYWDMVQHPEPTAIIKAKEWINKIYKQYPKEFLQIEFVRK